MLDWDKWSAVAKYGPKYWGQLRHLPKLSDLTLNFEEGDTNDLADGLAQCQALRRLSLSLRRRQSMGADLPTCIARLKKVEDVTLDLSLATINALWADVVSAPALKRLDISLVRATMSEEFGRGKTIPSINPRQFLSRFAKRLAPGIKLRIDIRELQIDDADSGNSDTDRDPESDSDKKSDKEWPSSARSLERLRLDCDYFYHSVEHGQEQGGPIDLLNALKTQDGLSELDLSAQLGLG